MPIPAQGPYSCSYMPGLAAAAITYVKLGSACRGRCLLTTNGTLEIAATLDNTTFTSAHFNTTAMDPATPSSESLTPTLLDYTCPCNCTYVSKACCLSPTGLVYEDPVMRIDADVQAPNGSVCCDRQTGNWTRATVARDRASLDPACDSASSSSSTDTGIIRT